MIGSTNSSFSGGAGGGINVITFKQDYTLLASNWVGTEAPYIYQVTVDGHGNTEDYVNLMIADSTTDEQYEAICAADIKDIDWVDNTTLELKAYGVKPEIDAVVRIEVNTAINSVEGITAEKIGAAPISYVKKVGNPYNLLDNSDFRNPVNQRGLTSYIGSNVAPLSYSIDRWKGVNATYTIKDGYINFTTLKNLTYKRFVQSINTTIKAGKAYTIAMRARVNEVGIAWLRPCNSAYGTVTGVTHLDINTTTTDFETFVFSFTPTNDEVNPGFDLLCMNTENHYADIDIEWVAWYEGEYTLDTLPEYQPKGYGVELTNCINSYADPADTYANGATMHLLWENASTTSSFAAQKLIFNHSKYRFLLFDMAVENTLATRFAVIVPLSSTSGRLMMVSIQTFYRDFTIETDGISIGNCGGSNNLNNSALYNFPVKIYGIK